MQRSGDQSSRRKEPFYFSKWLTFSAAAMLQLSAGLGYTFSIYSNALKSHFKCVPASHVNHGLLGVEPEPKIWAHKAAAGRCH